MLATAFAQLLYPTARDRHDAAGQVVTACELAAVLSGDDCPAMPARIARIRFSGRANDLARGETPAEMVCAIDAGLCLASPLPSVADGPPLPPARIARIRFPRPDKDLVGHQMPAEMICAVAETRLSDLAGSAIAVPFTSPDDIEQAARRLGRRRRATVVCASVDPIHRNLRRKRRKRRKLPLD